MSALDTFSAWIEATRMAQAIGESMWLIASLSAMHVVGYTLVVGSALVANLRWMGVILPKLPAVAVTRPASRGIAVGLAISVVTGVLLVSWKASAALSNSIFQTKMLLLVVAVSLQFAWQRSLSRRDVVDTRPVKAMAGIALAVWLGLAVAGCAFILFE